MAGCFFAPVKALAKTKIEPPSTLRAARALLCDYLNESLYSLVSSSASAETIIET